jgi:competence protein ComEC
MVDPTFEVITQNICDDRLDIDCFISSLTKMRRKWVNILEKTLPEPMSSLAAGILLGVKSQLPQEFYDKLVSTGTLHIVAASGYNVSIVATVLMNMITGVVSRGWGIVFGIIGIVLYVLISGGSASVVRAGVMGSLTLIAYYFGRPAEARRLLWVTGVIMLIINPLMLIDIGFQLSFVATAGMLYIVPWIETHCWENKFLNDYLYPTLAATTATMPVILYHFGRVSLISPVVNMLVLPLVPLIMFVTMMVMLAGLLSIRIGQFIALLVYAPLWYVVKIIQFFG